MNSRGGVIAKGTYAATVGSTPDRKELKRKKQEARADLRVQIAANRAESEQRAAERIQVRTERIEELKSQRELINTEIHRLEELNRIARS